VAAAACRSPRAKQNAAFLAVPVGPGGVTDELRFRNS
jgi:hypothetical protein